MPATPCAQQPKNRTLLFAAISIALSTLWGTNGVAEDVAIAYPQTAALQESFDPTAAVSGGVVVGLRIGEPHGKLAVQDVQFVGTSQSTVCVRAVTRDGRFSSNNKYVIKGNGNATRVRLLPITTQYSKALAKYDGSEYALSVFVASGNDCAPKGALLLPQVVPQSQSPDILTVLVNSSSRRVFLRGGSGTNESSCELIPDGARIAFDSECRLNIANLRPGPINLTIAMDDGFGVEEEKILVALPPRSP